MANKIYLNHTLEEYNKKYGDKNLKKVSKVDVDNNKSLLDGKSWWLINDIYYEVPNDKNGFVAWWHNLGRTGQIILCSCLGVAVTTAIVVPLAIGCNNKGYKVVVDSEDKVIIASQKKLDNGAVEINLSYDTDKKEIDSLSVSIGNQTLTLNSDYLLDGNKITIQKSVFDNNKSLEIVIKIKLKDKTPSKPVYVTKVECDEEKSMKVGDVLKFDDLHIKITPDNATDKTYYITTGAQSNEGGILEIDNDKKEIKAKGSGDQQIIIVPNGASPEAGMDVAGYCSISVTTKTSIKLNKSKVDMGVGRTFKLKATTDPEGMPVTFTSSDPKRISVSDDGTLTANEEVSKENKVIITASSDDGYATCDVTSFNFKELDWNTTNLEDKEQTVYSYCDGSSKYSFVDSNYEIPEGFDDGLNCEEPETSGGKMRDGIKLYKGTESGTHEGEVIFQSKDRIAIDDDDKVGTLQIKGLFGWDKNVKTVEFNNIDTYLVTNMSNMFYNCGSINYINGLTMFDTSNVTNFSYMFKPKYQTIDSLDLSSFDTSKATNMEGMFYNCGAKNFIDVTSFDTSNVTNMTNMFSGIKTNSLDLSSFDTSNVEKMGGMFMESSDLKTIYVSDKFITTSVTDSNNMFDTCTNLVGGEGSTQALIQKLDNEHYTDATYARIDRGSTIDKVGYFTSKDATLEKLSFVNPSSEEPYTCEVKAASNDIVNAVVIPNEVDGSMCGGKSDIKYKVNKVADNGFKNITGITSLFTPSTIISIGEYAFDGCTGLTSIKLNENLLEINQASFRGTNITSICIPDSVQLINTYAFDKSKKLENLYISNKSNLNEMGTLAFGSTKLTSFYIPKNVTKLSGSTATSSADLTLIVIDSPTIAVMDNPGNLFELMGWESPGYKTIKVPKGTTVGKDLTKSYTKQTSEGNYDVYTNN